MPKIPNSRKTTVCDSICQLFRSHIYTHAHTVTHVYIFFNPRNKNNSDNWKGNLNVSFKEIKVLLPHLRIKTRHWVTYPEADIIYPVYRVKCTLKANRHMTNFVQYRTTLYICVVPSYYFVWKRNHTWKTCERISFHPVYSFTHIVQKRIISTGKSL